MVNMNKEILDRLEEQFTIDQVDFYGDGEDVSTFVFFASEVSSERAGQLWDDYSEKYEEEEFDGAYEDYLQELNIRYWIL
jgi:hypothetical protein